MKRPVTVGAWRRRAALMGACLAAAAALFVAGEHFGLTWLKGVAIVVAAIGALGQFWIKWQHTQLEGDREQAQLDHRLLVPVDDVLNVDPTLIGVDAAPAQDLLEGGKVPNYVDRDVDGDLRTAVAAAIDGSGPWLVVVVGPSKVGKSRALFEALCHRSRRTALQLVAPVGNAAVDSLVTPGEMPAIGDGRTVLWLDDLEPFMDQGLNLQKLHEWRSRWPDGIVVATFGGKGSERLPEPRAEEIQTAAGDLLTHGREVTMGATTAAELDPVLKGLSPATSHALQAHGLAAFLVAGPALARKLVLGEGGYPGGLALVRAIVDWALCGRTDPVDRNTAAELWRSRVDPAVRTDAAEFQRAVAWACDPVAGRIALIRETDRGFEPYDYVVRLIADQLDGAGPSEATWLAALSTVTPAGAMSVGLAARDSDRVGDAIRAWVTGARSLVDVEVARADYNIAVALGDLGHFEVARQCYSDLIARFANSEREELQDIAASSFINRASIDKRRGEQKLVLDALNEVEDRYSAIESRRVRRRVAAALANKGVVLREFDPEGAIDVYAEVLRRYEGDSHPDVRLQVIRALSDRAVIQAEHRKRYRDSVADSDRAIEMCGDRPEFATLAARALFNKALSWSKEGDPDKETEALQEIIDRFADHPDPDVAEVVGRARRVLEDDGDDA